MHTKDIENIIEFYDKYYVSCTQTLNKNIKIYLGENKNKTCRFCGKSTPDVKFSKLAHALPELIGNKSLFSNYECDTCNEVFANSIEDNLSKFLGVGRTLFQIRGKKGIPKYKSNKKNVKIQFTDELIIEASDKSEDISLNEKTMSLTISKQKYIPILVYKCFVKMALSLLGEAELKNFSRTVRWLNPNDNVNITTKSLLCIISISPSYMSSDMIHTYLFKRKNDSDLVPYMSFFIMFSCYSFQIFIPFSEKDKHIINKDLELKSFASIMKENEDINFFVKEFSSENPVYSEFNKYTIHFGSITKHA